LHIILIDADSACGSEVPVNAQCRSSALALLVVPFVTVALSFPHAAVAQPPAKTSLAGAWTLNKDLSDQPPRRGDDVGAERGRRAGGRGSGGGGGRGMGRGGLGGGRMGGGGAGRGGMDPENMARMRQAMRDVTEPSDHLTITETESMVVLTDKDGRTTRLSTDGKKVKDENTKIERKTRWEAGKLVSEISGASPRKVTQTFAVEPDARQLRIVVNIEGSRGEQPRTITHVYDRDEH
jgi:hypothetical protein